MTTYCNVTQNKKWRTPLKVWVINSANMSVICRVSYSLQIPVELFSDPLQAFQQLMKNLYHCHHSNITLTAGVIISWEAWWKILCKSCKHFQWNILIRTLVLTFHAKRYKEQYNLHYICKFFHIWHLLMIWKDIFKIQSLTSIILKVTSSAYIHQIFSSSKIAKSLEKNYSGGHSSPNYS